MTTIECNNKECNKIATVQISHCNTKNGGLEKGNHFKYYCDTHYHNDTKNIPYPCFITDIGLII